MEKTKGTFWPTQYIDGLHLYKLLATELES